MLDQLKEFYSNNSTMVIIAIIALVAMVGMFMFKRNTLQQQSNTLSDLQLNYEGGKNDSVEELCDLETGMCYPQNPSDLQIHQEQHMTPEMQQQLMQDHQMMQEQQQMLQEEQ